ncbi:MAG: PEP-CTERM sorting domain-containing protein [Thermodesulfobacteriota bacterium]|nr:PEP-CTERM sorting domain-containing protein [Thermodesulfobacteriota bacterium]
MKNLLMLLCGVTLLFGMIGLASATPITFIDTTTFTENGTNPSEDLDCYGGDAVNKLEGRWDYVAWTHHYEFTPPAAEVLSGTLTLSLHDDGGLGDGPEFAFGWAEDGTWAFGEVDTALYDFEITASFLEDGAFSVVLASLGGDFYINYSELEITYNAAPVPEPGTILLLGAGLLGVVGYNRKRFGKKA